MTTFKRLLGFLRPYKRGLTASWALASFAMVLSVLLIIFTGLAVEAIRKGTTHAQHHELAQRAHDRHTLLVLAIAIATAVLVRWLLTYFRRLIAGQISLGIARDRRPAGRALLPRLRPRVHPAVRAHDRARGRRDDLHQPRPRADRDGARAVRRVHLPAPVSYTHLTLP